MSQDPIEWLYGLQHFGVKLGLENIRGLLEILGRPDHNLRIVHVGGTNGKGSVAAMLDAILAADGLRNGLFTSPHLVRPHERIRLTGADIEDGALRRGLEHQRATIDAAVADRRLEVHPSFFEVVTATALTSFAEQRLDTAVLEVGLGGRLDATNAVSPDVSTVVSVGLDHTKTLGPTLDKIAFEKAGIVKPGAPLVSGATQQRVIDLLRRTCRERGAVFVDARTHVAFTAERDNELTFVTDRARYDGLLLRLPGRHQIDNARVAIACYEILMERMGREPQPEAVRAGLARTRWRGRLEWIPAGEGRPALLLDAAHNPAGMLALTGELRRRRLQGATLLFGATTGKPIERLLLPLREFAEALVITRPPVKRGVDPEDVEEEARRIFDDVTCEGDPRRALDAACRRAGPDGTLLVTGSLYLVGEILGILEGGSVPGPVAM